MPLIGRVGSHRGFEEQIWQNWADLLRTEVLLCGHFLPEEQPDHVAAAIHNLLTRLTR